ncbi:hypothetical protein P280DRAFT_147584 [Massarina eburnea CBS 473.64]|uniref:Uncharacterized protein n=1 Tax=Massarina eburnea CBS 473.64 TaxID=1395130 RepID=A0A6A6RN29_9PLEO|nr:hypothetical protein P280DRAFT_147584 [Massarina eburnea CBS 473.64]
MGTASHDGRVFQDSTTAPLNKSTDSTFTDGGKRAWGPRTSLTTLNRVKLTQRATSWHLSVHTTSTSSSSDGSTGSVNAPTWSPNLASMHHVASTGDYLGNTACQFHILPTC